MISSVMVLFFRRLLPAELFPLSLQTAKIGFGPWKVTAGKWLAASLLSAIFFLFNLSGNALGRFQERFKAVDGRIIPNEDVVIVATPPCPRMFTYQPILRQDAGRFDLKVGLPRTLFVDNDNIHTSNVSRRWKGD